MPGFSYNDKDLIRKLTEVIQANLGDENFGVTELSRETGINYYSLNRKLRLVLKKTTSQFICEIRLQRARELLEREDLTAGEVAYRVGFSSPAYFSRCFHEYYGFPPGAIKRGVITEQQESSNKPSLNSNTEEVPVNFRAQQYSWERQRRKRVIISAGIILIFVILSFFFFPLLFKNFFLLLNPKEKSIAVLPFRNLSNEDDYLYFAEGVTGSILNNLMQFEKLKVISFISNDIDKPDNKGALDFVKKHRADYILSGSVQYQSGRFLILVKLVDVRTNLQIWSDKIEGEISNIFEAQSDIAKNIGIQLHAVLAKKETNRISKIPTKNIVAYSHYLKGRYFLNRRNLDAGVSYFNKAIAVDPNYAEAYAGLADAIFNGTKGKWYPRTEGYAKTKKNVLRALELDNHLSEAHATLGTLLCFSEWKWEEGREEFIEAIKLNPNSVTAHLYYGEYLLILGQLKDAREHLDLACELDPTSSINLILSARCYMSEGKFPEALEESRKIVELDAGLFEPYFINFYIYRKTGDELKAVEAIERALSILEADKKYAVKVRDVYSKSGMTGLLKMLIEYEHEDLEFGILGAAKLYCFLGMKDKALDCLEKAMSMEKRYPELPLINCEMGFEELRTEPRFQVMLKKMGLSDYQPRNFLLKLPQ